MIYQTLYSFPSESKPLTTKFCKRFVHNIEDNKILSVIFDVHFDL